MDEIIGKTIEIVFSSTRAMPAKYCGPSFCIDFEPLTPSDEYEMAGWALLTYTEFVLVPEKKTMGKESSFPIKCGEDLMLGAFILTKLGGERLLDKLAPSIIERNIKKSHLENPSEILNGVGVKKYLEWCLDYGHGRAKPR